MVKNTKAIGSIIKEKVMVFFIIKMEIDMKDYLKITFQMEKGFITSITEIATTEILLIQ
jgi:hypothetical protein